MAQEPLFDTLRSKEQLAYDVSINIQDNYGIMGYSITVNSQEPKFAVDYVDKRIESFREDLIKTIQSMPEKDFEAMKASLIKVKLNEDNKLSEEVTRNWAEVTSDEYEFDRPHKEVEQLERITKDQLLEFYQLHRGNSECKLSIQVIGNALNIDDQIDENDDFEKNEDLDTRRKRFDTLTFVPFNGDENGHLITNLMEFKNTLDVYPVTKTNRRLV